MEVRKKKEKEIDTKVLKHEFLLLKREAGVIWEQELYNNFEYAEDAPFFHSFETDVK